MKLPRQFLILLLRLYQKTLSPVLSALFGPAGHCRFTPSCSQYAIDALRTHGVFQGGFLAARRLLRCHPWGGCGFDPVPGAAAGTLHPDHDHAHPAGDALGVVARGH